MLLGRRCPSPAGPFNRSNLLPMDFLAQRIPAASKGQLILRKGVSSPSGVVGEPQIVVMASAVTAGLVGEVRSRPG